MAQYKGSKNTLHVTVGQPGRNGPRMTFHVGVAAGNGNKEVSLNSDRVRELRAQINEYLGDAAAAPNQAMGAAPAPAQAAGTLRDRVQALHDEIDTLLSGERQYLEDTRDSLSELLDNL
jgi:hypothetical protein